MARRPRSAGRRLVTLTTDIGAAYAAQMKAVLARSLPPGRVIDLVHDLPPHEVREAAFLLRAMGGGFPAGTVHVAVVDPGVGGHRAPLALACADGSVLIGPDNGVLSLLAEQLGGAKGFRLRPSRLGPRSRVGTTFDGRDVFAPAAALVARGTPPERLGDPVSFERIALPTPRRHRRGARGEIVHADRFGNLVTNIPTEWIPPRTTEVALTIGRTPRARALPRAVSYEELGAGTLGVLGSSFGLVEIAVALGSAARRLRAGPGTRVDLDWGQSRSRQ